MDYMLLMKIQKDRDKELVTKAEGKLGTGPSHFEFRNHSQLGQTANPFMKHQMGSLKITWCYFFNNKHDNIFKYSK